MSRLTPDDVRALAVRNGHSCEATTVPVVRIGLFVPLYDALHPTQIDGIWCNGCHRQIHTVRFVRNT